MVHEPLASPKEKYSSHPYSTVVHHADGRADTDTDAVINPSSFPVLATYTATVQLNGTTVLFTYARCCSCCSRSADADASKARRPRAGLRRRRFAGSSARAPQRRRPFASLWGWARVTRPRAPTNRPRLAAVRKSLSP